jgi:multidrug efflux pump subunit AcrB
MQDFCRLPPRKITAVVSIITLGLLSLFFVRFTIWPNFYEEYLKITSISNDLSQDETLEKLTIPIEQQLLQFSQIEEFLSRTAPGRSTTIVQVMPGIDIYDLRTQIARRIAAGSGSTSVSVSRFGNEPVLQIAFYSKSSSDLPEITNIAKDFFVMELASRLRSGMIQSEGAAKRQIIVRMNVFRLTQYKVTPLELKERLESAGLPEETGVIRNGSELLPSVFSEKISSLDEVKNLSISDRDRNVRLQDVASANVEIVPESSVFLLNGNPGVLIQLFDAPGLNILRASSLVKELLNEIRPKLPKGVTGVVLSDQGQHLKNQIKLFLYSILIGFAAVLLVSIIAKKKLQDVMAILIIPCLSVLITVLLIWIAGLRLDIFLLTVFVLCAGSQFTLLILCDFDRSSNPYRIPLIIGILLFIAFFPFLFGRPPKFFIPAVIYATTFTISGLLIRSLFGKPQMVVQTETITASNTIRSWGFIIASFIILTTGILALLGMRWETAPQTDQKIIRFRYPISAEAKTNLTIDQAMQEDLALTDFLPKTVTQETLQDSWEVDDWDSRSVSCTLRFKDALERSKYEAEIGARAKGVSGIALELQNEIPDVLSGHWPLTIFAHRANKDTSDTNVNEIADMLEKRFKSATWRPEPRKAFQLTLDQMAIASADLGRESILNEVQSASGEKELGLVDIPGLSSRIRLTAVEQNQIYEIPVAYSSDGTPVFLRTITSGIVRRMPFERIRMTGKDANILAINLSDFNSAGEIVKAIKSSRFKTHLSIRGSAIKSFVVFHESIYRFVIGVIVLMLVAAFLSRSFRMFLRLAIALSVTISGCFLGLRMYQDVVFPGAFIPMILCCFLNAVTIYFSEIDFQPARILVGYISTSVYVFPFIFINDNLVAPMICTYLGGIVSSSISLYLLACFWRKKTWMQKLVTQSPS